MKKGISISIQWWDEDIVIFLFNASNDTFCGEVEMYLGPDALQQLGKNLEGFPRDAKDRRVIDLGAFSMRHAGGGVQLKFVCLDAACHVAVDVRIRTQDCDAFGELQSVALRIPIEAAAVDRFVDQLLQFKLADLGIITLPMAQ